LKKGVILPLHPNQRKAKPLPQGTRMPPGLQELKSEAPLRPYRAKNERGSPKYQPTVPPSSVTRVEGDAKSRRHTRDMAWRHQIITNGKQVGGEIRALGKKKPLALRTEGRPNANQGRGGESGLHRVQRSPTIRDSE